MEISRPLRGREAIGLISALLFFFVVSGDQYPGVSPASGKKQPAVGQIDPEKHLKNIQQLTFGGENAEAYFSGDGKQLILQSTRDGRQCDQIYTMTSTGKNIKMVSTGKGRCTCAFFAPDNKRIIYSSTHLGGTECPPKPDYSLGYVWALFKTYDIFSAKPDGSDLKQLTHTPGYDAEAVYSPDSKKILFTSDRDGDLELYEMNADGSNLQRLTDSPGYDGGAFYSADGTKICFRAHIITDSLELKEYQALLQQGLIRPGLLEIFVMNTDGTGRTQLTHNGAANFCPFFSPDGKKIIFSSNMHDPQGRNFELYLINIDGTGLEQITYNPTFDGFPMFSPDGKKLVFGSNRNARVPGETNIFIADWVW